MRILLVEDEKKVADIIARGLKAERYAVDGARGKAQADGKWPALMATIWQSSI